MFGSSKPCYSCCKRCLQMWTIIFKTLQINVLLVYISLYFRNIFLIGGLISLWSRSFTIFQKRIPK